MKAAITRLTGAEAWEVMQPYLVEVSDIGRDSMHRALHNSSPAWIGSAGDRVLGVWGLIPPTLLSDTAYLWLYTTEHLREHQFMFVRHSQRVIAEALVEFPNIVGHCMANNYKAHRWLRWLGAEFRDPQGELISFLIKAK